MTLTHGRLCATLTYRINVTLAGKTHRSGTSHKEENAQVTASCFLHAMTDKYVDTSTGKVPVRAYGVGGGGDRSITPLILDLGTR